MTIVFCKGRKNLPPLKIRSTSRRRRIESRKTPRSRSSSRSLWEEIGSRNHINTPIAIPSVSIVTGLCLCIYTLLHSRCRRWLRNDCSPQRRRFRHNHYHRRRRRRRGINTEQYWHRPRRACQIMFHSSINCRTSLPRCTPHRHPQYIRSVCGGIWLHDWIRT